MSAVWVCVLSVCLFLWEVCMYFDTAMYLESVRICVLLIKSTYQWPERLVIATRHGALGALRPDPAFLGT